MFTTIDLLDLFKKSNGNCSNYRAAQLLDISRNTPSGWINRGYVMDDETALKIAFSCKLDPDYVLTCINAERAKGTDIFTTWKHIAERLQPSNMAA